MGDGMTRVDAGDGFGGVGCGRSYCVPGNADAESGEEPALTAESAGSGEPAGMTWTLPDR